MSYILNIETSSPVCSVCLSLDGEVIATKESKEEQNHASVLNFFIEELFKESKREIKGLSAVAVSAGPGSYTGLRIGVSTAKGICYALNIPLIAVNTLKSMTWGYMQSVTLEKEALFCPVIDARRMEVYYGLYSRTGECLIENRNTILDNGFLKSYQNSPIHFFGSGAEKVKMFSSTEANNLFRLYTPSAVFLSGISFDYYIRKKFVSLAYFEPNYIKPVYTLNKEKIV